MKPAYSVRKRGEVEEPSIRMSEFLIENKEMRAICVQWFGESKLLEDKYQFLFPLTVGPHEVCWRGFRPRFFKVAFLGRVMDWIYQESIKKIAEAITNGRAENWMACISNPFCFKQYRGGIGFDLFMVPLILIADQEIGVITPQCYCNLEVLKPKQIS